MLEFTLQAVMQAAKSVDPWEVGKGLGGLTALGFLLKGTMTLARIEAHMAAHGQHDDERFAEVEKKFAGVERRMDGLNNAIAGIDAKLGAWYDGLVDRVQGLLLRIDERVDRLTDGRRE